MGMPKHISTVIFPLGLGLDVGSGVPRRGPGGAQAPPPPPPPPDNPDHHHLYGLL